jgi:hypothetical protein
VVQLYYAKVSFHVQQFPGISPVTDPLKGYNRYQIITAKVFGPLAGTWRQGRADFATEQFLDCCLVSASSSKIEVESSKSLFA